MTSNKGFYIFLSFAEVYHAHGSHKATSTPKDISMSWLNLVRIPLSSSGSIMPAAAGGLPLPIFKIFSPAAETGNSVFRSTHELEKVGHRILLEQCLLSTARYVVKWKSGIQSKINGCFSMSLALERKKEATKYRTFPFTIVALKSTDMSQILYHLNRSLSLR